MDRRQLLAWAAAASTPLPAIARQPVRTRWRIRGSEGFDALCFLGPLSGKPFYTRYYEAELAQFRLDEPSQAALTRLQAAADARKGLLAPGLCTLFSGGPDATLGELVASCDAPEARLLAPYRASPYWSEETWRAFVAEAPEIRTVLTGLQRSGFPEFRRRFVSAQLETRVAALGERLAGVDVIAEQERLLGRALESGVEIILLWFSKPHGVRVQGQRFLSHVSYSDELIIRTAAHEILHPPFPMDGPAARLAMQIIAQDPLFQRILAEHDPAFGYNSYEGIVNEDTVQALDQIISERLAVARDPAERWRKADDGMHVLAAGLYGLLKADGFDRRGGNIEAWLLAAARRGRLAPAVLHPAAAAVLKTPADQLWTKKPA
jgi:hypothetical protein